MRLTAPIFRLKHKAKLLSRTAGIPLNQALDRIAKNEGFNSWSLLASRASADRPSKVLLTQLKPGELVLLGARPGQGKTMLGLGLVLEALKAGRKGVFFTLEYNEQEVLKRFQSIHGHTAALCNNFHFDCSDAICADYVTRLLKNSASGTVVVIDYLQLLDQKRDTPELINQISTLSSFANETGVIIVCISQIDRSYELSGKPLPDLSDVRLPNPLDLSLFSKACFLHHGDMQIDYLNT